MARNRFARHPILALLAVNLAVLVLFALVAEVALRIWIPFNPGYYMAVEGPNRELHFPFGIIKTNSHGHPDDEFELGEQPRVGYFGDSVLVATEVKLLGSQTA